QIGERLGGMAQIREAEERRNRRARHHANSARAFLDFFPCGLWAALLDRSLKVCMGPGVAPDGMAGGDYLMENFRIVGRMLADVEEGCPQALVGERLENGLGRVEPGAVVEGQHDLVVA